jgi:outer membrane protein assembly factor BamB
MQSVRCFAALTILLAVLARAPRALGEDWPQFRGPNCSGVSTGTLPLPVAFSATENVIWSADLADTIGSPVVADGRVFTTGMEGEDAFQVYAFDAATGRPLWQTEVAVGDRPLPKLTPPNCHTSATPAADDERVYVYFSTRGLLAFDAQTGRQVWELELPVPYLVFDWGPGVSPVLYGDVLLFNQDDDLNPALYAVDKRTGTLLWKADRSEMLASYSLPVICQTADGPEVVVAGTGKLIGYDLATGAKRWQARTLLRNIKTTPVSHDGIVYVSLESAGIAQQWIAANDSNKDGRLSRDEIPAPFTAKFDRGDVILEGEELDLAFLDPDNPAGQRWNEGEQSTRYIQAVRGGGSGDVTDTHLLWRHQNRAPDGISSPLVVDGRMFVVKTGGISSCFEVEQGEPLWYLKRIDNIGSYYASPVCGDGKIYVTGENGVVVVLENSPELNVLATNDLGESCLGTPAIADGRLYFRTRGHLICVGNK